MLQITSGALTCDLFIGMDVPFLSFLLMQPYHRAAICLQSPLTARGQELYGASSKIVRPPGCV